MKITYRLNSPIFRAFIVSSGPEEAPPLDVTLRLDPSWQFWLSSSKWKAEHPLLATHLAEQSREVLRAGENADKSFVK